MMLVALVGWTQGSGLGPSQKRSGSFFDLDSQVKIMRTPTLICKSLSSWIGLTLYLVQSPCKPQLSSDKLGIRLQELRCGSGCKRPGTASRFKKDELFECYTAKVSSDVKKISVEGSPQCGNQCASLETLERVEIPVDAIFTFSAEPQVIEQEATLG